MSKAEQPRGPQSVPSGESSPRQLSPDRSRVILHPTDFTPTSFAAFAHALRLATYNQSELHILHVAESEDEPPAWHEFPAVRHTLERWGMIPEYTDRHEVEKLSGVRVFKANIHGNDVAEKVAEYVDVHAVDMVVLATGEHDDFLPRWFRRSVAESVLTTAKVPTLFVTYGARGCVSEDDGKVTLDKILVPVDRTPRPDAAIERAMMALAAFGKEDSMLTLLHVGPEGPYPWPTWPEGFRWKSTQLLRQGRPVDAILATAEEQGSDLIILVTDGAEGFFDVLRGSTTQQIVRRAPCPVLAIPHDF